MSTSVSTVTGRSSRTRRDRWRRRPALPAAAPRRHVTYVVPITSSAVAVHEQLRGPAVERQRVELPLAPIARASTVRSVPFAIANIVLPSVLTTSGSSTPCSCTLVVDESRAWSSARRCGAAVGRRSVAEPSLPPPAGGARAPGRRSCRARPGRRARSSRRRAARSGARTRPARSSRRTPGQAQLLERRATAWRPSASSAATPAGSATAAASSTAVRARLRTHCTPP